MNLVFASTAVNRAKIVVSSALAPTQIMICGSVARWPRSRTIAQSLERNHLQLVCVSHRHLSVHPRTLGPSVPHPYLPIAQWRHFGGPGLLVPLSQIPPPWSNTVAPKMIAHARHPFWSYIMLYHLFIDMAADIDLTWFSFFWVSALPDLSSTKIVEIMRNTAPPNGKSPCMRAVLVVLPSVASPNPAQWERGDPEWDPCTPNKERKH